MNNYLLRISLLFFAIGSWQNAKSCDGMSATVLSNVYMGNNQYQVTVQYCESVSNGAGANVSGIILQSSGAGTIVGTTTPSFTSNSTGVTINYNQINGNTVQWGEWDDNPNVPDFLQNGNATQCFTMVLNTNGPITSIAISGSSSSSNLGAGFVSWFGRWCCKMTITVPPVTCNSTWTPPQICPGSGPINLNTTSSLTGVFSGPGVNSATGIFTPSSTSLPAAITFTVGDAGLNCSTTLNITSPYTIAPINDQTICAGQSVNLVANATASLPCNYVLNLQDSYGDGWQGGASVSVYINGVLYGSYTLASGASQNINIPVSTGNVITLNYTAGSSWNSENRIRILNPSGTAIYTSAWGPSSGAMGGGITANCGTSSPYTYSWSPAAGLSNPAIANPVATPATTTTYTVTATSSSGCVLTEPVTITVQPGGTPTFNVLEPVCQNAPAPVLSTTSTNGITGTWSPATISTTSAGSTNYTFTPSGGACSTPYSFTFIVNPIPAVNAGVDQSICTGSAVTLAATGATTYSWNNSVTQGTSFTPIATNTYTVTGTGTGGCINTDQVLVTVNPIPVTNAGPDVAICSGQSVSLTASGAGSYSWSPGGQTTSTINVSPVVTTSYTVTGTSLGCTSTDVVTVSVSANAMMNAGTDVTLCLGQSTTLSATGGSAYSWDNGLGNGNNFSVSPNTTTTYIVTGTNAGGCIGTYAITVTVNPIPVINAGPDVNICNSGSTTLTASGATSYTWSPGGQTSNSITVSPSSATTYTVSGTTLGCISSDDVLVTVSPNAIIDAGPNVAICIGESVTLLATGGTSYSWDNGLGNGNNFLISPLITTTYNVTGTSAGGCIGTDLVSVTVNPLPVVDAGLPQIICANTPVTLTATGANTYTWDNSISQGVSFTPISTLTYTVTGTSNFGCIGSDNVLITVNPLPIVNAGIDQIACVGNSITLNGSGASVYVWTNGVNDGLAFNPPVGTTTYTVSATDANGCEGTDQVLVTINTLPNVNAGNDITICEGATALLTGSGASTYSWNNGITNGATFFPSLGTTTYTLTGTSSAGCVNTDQVNVTVNPNPIVSFIPGNSGCAPLTSSFTNTSTNSNSCVWSFSNGTTISGCGTIPVTFNQAGCYDVTLTTTSAQGCTASLSSLDIICVEANPIAEFSPSSNELPNTNTLVDFTNNSIGASSYFWSFGSDNATSTEENPSFIYPDINQGSYVVMLVATSPFGCVDTAYSTINVYEELIFYVPNTFTPDLDNFNPIFQPIFTSGFDPKDFVLYIYNRWGELIFESHDSAIGWDGSYGSNREIGLCQDGTYTWKIEFKTTRNDERKVYLGHVNIIR
jgi:gliding motility-associated-like protein